MPTKLTPENVEVGDRVAATEEMVWTEEESSKKINFTISKGALGTVVQVDRERWSVVIEWDNVPLPPSGEKPLDGMFYWPDNGGFRKIEKV